MKYITRLPLIILLSVFFASCEEQEYFKSESEIKKQLSYSWKQILMTSDTNDAPLYEVWSFKDDQLIFRRYKVTNNKMVDSLAGNFSVNTTLTKVFLTTSGFPDDNAWHQLNAEWTVVFLNNKALSMASEDSYGGGVIQREFTRID